MVALNAELKKNEGSKCLNWEAMMALNAETEKVMMALNAET